MTAISPSFRKRLLQERDDARADTRLKSRFLSYRLNSPSADEAQVLLTVDDYALMAGREVPQADGAAIVGVDLGHTVGLLARQWLYGLLGALTQLPSCQAYPRFLSRREGTTYQGVSINGWWMMAGSSWPMGCGWCRLKHFGMPSLTDGDTPR